MLWTLGYVGAGSATAGVKGQVGGVGRRGTCGPPGQKGDQGDPGHQGPKGQNTDTLSVWEQLSGDTKDCLQYTDNMFLCFQLMLNNLSDFKDYYLSC